MVNESINRPFCRGTKLQSGTADVWEVEFAREGMSGRGETTGPSSLVLSVDLGSEQVKAVELM